MTFGGHGGGKCAEKLGDVIVGGVKAKLVETVQITLPGEYIRTGARVRKGEGWPEFLDKYEKLVEEAFQKLELAVLDAEKAVDEGKTAH